MHQQVRTAFGEAEANALIAQGWELIDSHLFMEENSFNDKGQATVRKIKMAYVMGLPRVQSDAPRKSKVE